MTREKHINILRLAKHTLDELRGKLRDLDFADIPRHELQVQREALQLVMREKHRET